MINLNEKTSYQYILGYILVVTSGYYITKLFLSPIYFALLIVLYGYLIMIFIKNKIIFNYILFIPFIYIVYLALTQLDKGKLNTTINVIMSISYFILTYIVVKGLSLEKIKKISLSLIRFSIPLLVFEAYYRLTNPMLITDTGFDYTQHENLLFYAYKFNSIMYQDSNFVGIFIVVLLFYCTYLSQKYYISFKFEKLILFLLILLTLSRAAIVSTIFFLIFYYFWFKSTKKDKFFIFLFSSLLLVIILVFLKADSSFQSKFRIIDFYVDFIKTGSIEHILFGVGFGKTADYFPIGGHNFFIATLQESGIIGFLLLFLFMISIILKTRYKGLIILLPFLLTSMSLVGHAIPYLYAIMVLIILQEEKNNEKNTLYS